MAARCRELLYPYRCPLCTQIVPDRKRLICRECSRKLPWIREPFCRICGKPLADDRREYCRDCMNISHRFEEGRCVFLYEGELRQSVVRMKFENHREYIRFYAASMAEYAEEFLKKVRPQLLIPVPMNRKKVRERGFDQCQLLGEQLGRLCGLPVEKSLVKRIRYTLPQKGLDIRQRRDNLRGAFSVAGTFEKPVRILLIDDIYTTGSTMDEMSRVLKDAGAGEVFFLALCTGKGKEAV